VRQALGAIGIDIRNAAAAIFPGQYL
jgi:hypothetical protein